MVEVVPLAVVLRLAPQQLSFEHLLLAPLGSCSSEVASPGGGCRARSRGWSSKLLVQTPRLAGPRVPVTRAGPDLEQCLRAGSP